PLPGATRLPVEAMHRPPAVMRLQEETTASADCRTSAARWPSRGGCRWLTRKRKPSSPTPYLSGDPAWRLVAIRSANCSISKKERPAPFTRPCFIRRRNSPYPTGHPTTATGPCHQLSCRYRAQRLRRLAPANVRLWFEEWAAHAASDLADL